MPWNRISNPSYSWILNRIHNRFLDWFLEINHRPSWFLQRVRTRNRIALFYFFNFNFFNFFWQFSFFGWRCFLIKVNIKSIWIIFILFLFIGFQTKASLFIRVNILSLVHLFINKHFLFCLLVCKSSCCIRIIRLFFFNKSSLWIGIYLLNSTLVIRILSNELLLFSSIIGTLRLTVGIKLILLIR